jgi:hypothetical protein
LTLVKHSLKTFIECPIKVLDKKTVVDVQFTEIYLPRVTLGKQFAECFLDNTRERRFRVIILIMYALNFKENFSGVLGCTLCKFR